MYFQTDGLDKRLVRKISGAAKCRILNGNLTFGDDEIVNLKAYINSIKLILETDVYEIRIIWNQQDSRTVLCFVINNHNCKSQTELLLLRYRFFPSFVTSPNEIRIRQVSSIGPSLIL